MKFFFKGSVFSIDVPSNVVMEGDTITITPIESFDTGVCENECESVGIVSMRKKVDSIVSDCFNRRVNKYKCRAEVFDSFPEANAIILDAYFNRSWNVFKARAKNLEAKKGKAEGEV